MPITVKEQPIERQPSWNVRPPHVATYAECVLRIDKLAVGLHVRETGSATPHWETSSLTTGMMPAEIANDLIVLARTLADILDQEYPISSLPRH